MNAENRIADLEKQIEELTDKHWEGCRQIALYDDELKTKGYVQGYKDGLRSKALEELIPTFEKMGVTFSETLKDITKTLIDRMSIQVDMRKQGCWSECFFDDRIYSGICSVCGKASIRNVNAEPLTWCPNCGAKMDGES